MTSSGCGPSWPPTAGHWTTHATPRTPNSHPASARHPARPSALSLLAALDGVLDGREGPLVPMAAGDLRESELLTTSLRVGEEIDDDVALVVSTSGTTGTPKGAMLTPAALIASASATHDRSAEQATWLLALPTITSPGSRCWCAVCKPARSRRARRIVGFDVTQLPTAVAQLGSGRRYTSLVATQLAKALADPEATAALAELDAVLLGGGPAPADRCSRAPRPRVSRWCAPTVPARPPAVVYYGVPLDGAQVRLDAGAEPGEGRIAIGGATLAKGYRNPPSRTRSPSRAGFDRRSRPARRGGPTGGARSSRRGDQHRRADRDAHTRGGGAVAAPGGRRLRGVRGARRAPRRAGGGGRRAGQRVRSSRVWNDIRTYLAQSLDSTAAPRELHIIYLIHPGWGSASWTAGRCGCASKTAATCRAATVGEQLFSS